MAEKTAGLRIGEILQALGLVSEHQLKEAIRLAGEVALPLGRAVVLYGYLSQHELDMALELQSLIKNRGLPIDTGVRAFKMAVREKMDIATALESVGFTGSTISISASRLGTLLLDAGLVTPAQLEVAQRASYETGQPIGKMLVSMGIMTQALIEEALSVQKNVREERVSYSQALNQLMPVAAAKNAVVDKALVPTAADRVALGQKKIRLGELLVLSGLISEMDIMNALEYGLSKPDQPFGKSLIDLGLLNIPMLDLALNLQELICEGTLSLPNAVDTLYSYSLTTKAEQAPEVPTLKLGELLKRSGIVTDAEINQAIDLSSRYPSVIGKMLVISGAISEATLLAALRCQFLLRRQLISLEQAIEALQHADEHRMSLDDSLEEMGVQTPS